MFANSDMTYTGVGEASDGDGGADGGAERDVDGEGDGVGPADMNGDRIGVGDEDGVSGR